MTQTTSKTTAKKTTRRPAASRERAGPSVPVPVPEVHLHQVHLPNVGVPSVHVPDAVRRRVPGRLGSRVLLFGGLAGLAATGVIAWPVAGAVAAGTYAAERWARDGAREDLSARPKS